MQTATPQSVIRRWVEPGERKPQPKRSDATQQIQQEAEEVSSRSTSKEEDHWCRSEEAPEEVIV